MRDTLSNLTPSPLRKVIKGDALDETMDASSQSDIRGLKRKAQSAGYDDVRPYDGSCLCYHKLDGALLTVSASASLAVRDGIRRTSLRNVKACKLANAMDPAARSARNISLHSQL
jgi:hypothetical protein